MSSTPARSKTKPAILTFLLVLVLATAASYLWQRSTSASASGVVQTLQATPQTAPHPPPQPPANSAPAQEPQAAAPAQPPATPAAADPPPTAMPSLRAWVVHAGQDTAADNGKISLPTGAQFAIKVQTTASGQVAFYTINPQGISSSKALWKTAVQAGQAVTGPKLRLSGSTGLETLRLLFTPDGATDPIEQHLQIWHLATKG